ASGIAVADECKVAYQQLKSRQAKFVIFKVSDDKTSVVVDKVSKDKDYDVFLAALPETDCRFAVYDFEYEIAGGGKRNKILFYTWSPDNAGIKPKTLYASSRSAIRMPLDGISNEIQGTDMDEVSYETGTFAYFQVLIRSYR
ncbi:putative COF1-cofilin, partial [Clavulina sp. PMI_390]